MSIWYTTTLKFKGSPENLSKLIDELAIKFPEKEKSLRAQVERGGIWFSVDGRFIDKVISELADKYNVVGAFKEANDMQEQYDFGYNDTWSIYDPATREWTEEERS